jgi:hypothetical protein
MSGNGTAWIVVIVYFLIITGIITAIGVGIWYSKTAHFTDLQQLATSLNKINKYKTLYHMRHG